MLHETAPMALNNTFAAQTPREEDPILCYAGDQLLVADDERVAYPTWRMLPTDSQQTEYLFAMGDQPYFLHCLPEKCDVPGFHWVDIRALRYGMPMHAAYAGILGHHLYQWYASRRHCGRCGERTVRDTHERMIHCEACGQKEYPVIMPAVIVGVIRGNSLLMTKYANRPNPNWALVAGFCEVGETLEQTVAREVLEEVGLRVKHITYYKSQPWPFSGSLLAGFFAEAADDLPIVLDDQELAEAAFLPREDIAVPFEGRALTNEMICFFRDYGADAALRVDQLRQEPFQPLA